MILVHYLGKILNKVGKHISEDENDPIPGLVLLFYMLIIYLFFGMISGCGSEWAFQIGRATTPSHLHRAIPADSQSCRVDFHPWNEPCDNP